MTDRRSYLESLTPKMGLALLPAVLFFVFVLNGHAYSATEPDSSPQDSADVLKNPKIDRIIPSKPDDLFVVLKNGLTVLI
ncbi:MAG: hypothetical protein V3V47_00735, partial [Desulfobacteria bacterium]